MAARARLNCTPISRTLLLGVPEFAGSGVEAVAERENLFEDKLLVDLGAKPGFASVMSWTAMKSGEREGDYFRILEDQRAQVHAVWTSLPRISAFSIDLGTGRAVLTAHGSSLAGLGSESHYYQCR